MTIACFCGTVYQTAGRVSDCPDCGTTTTVPTVAYLRTLEQIRSLPETEDGPSRPHTGDAHAARSVPG